ncbi:MAG: hypothetical protein JW768_07040, partial [Chitinispirillaceae bacterium]|nr:hypothetical protein [Chitinispirillaceae bacterium]
MEEEMVFSLEFWFFNHQSSCCNLQLKGMVHGVVFWFLFFALGRTKGVQEHLPAVLCKKSFFQIRPLGAETSAGRQCSRA